MGRIVVITGGTSGIGLKLKELFEKAGDTVLTFSLDETGASNHYQGSVDHEIKVKQVFNDIHERFGKIDILINSAGIGMSAITEVAPMDEIKRVMDVNFYGTLYCTRSALQFMSKGAKIINMSSAMALFPVPFRSIYGSAKSAVLNLSFALRMELAPHGIDVIAMCPGDTKTNFTKSRVKDFSTTERYGDRLETATLSSDANEDKRMSVDYVAETIFNLLGKKKSKPFYIIGGKYKMLYFLTRLTPKSLLLNATNKRKGGKIVKVEEKPKKEKKAPAPKETIAEVKEVSEVQPEIQNTPVENVNTTNPNLEDTTSEETTTNDTPKKDLNSILSKISILNKPTENNEEDKQG